MSKSLLTTVRLRYLPLDLTFGILIPLAIVNGIEAADFTYSLVVFYIAGVMRSLLIQFGFGQVFGPIDRWLESASTRPDSTELNAIDSMIQRGPVRLIAWVGGAWTLQLIIALLWLLFVTPYRAAIPPRAITSAVLMIGGVILGSVPLTVPMMSVLMNDSARRLFAIAHNAGIQLRRDRSSLKFKLLYLMAATGLAGPVWIASTSTQVDTSRATLEARMQSSVVASELGRRIATINPTDTAALNAAIQKLREDIASGDVGGAAVTSISISDKDGKVIAGERKMSPPLVDWLAAKTAQASQPSLPAAPGTQEAKKKKLNYEISPRDGEVVTRMPALNELSAVVVTSIGDWTSGSLLIILIAFFLVLLTWTPVCSYYLSIDVVRPIQDITRAVQQITEVGKLDEVATIPVTQNDETGVLAAKFNDLVETLRDLSAAAGALAKGDLEIRLSGEGDVATAFRAMIESLGRIVRQIHETSVLLAAAATEIYAASQEQEAAAASQSTAMAEIRQTMESLFEAAAHVAESVRGVLSNAERTLETTDRMVVRIGDLTNHAGRIGEILETIRDISDRSDLLALNGALEASRAGEAGRGFGLVAAEMRRLAERVMSSVHDVRSLVGDIRASGSSTMMATEDSKKLAASTTDAARQITMVTQQQRSGTEQVLQSVREIAETLAQSVSAMAQSRASAEQLKSQADKLSTLVRAFRIENPQT
jgi:methyl-accepting chemotaxis protein